MTLAAQSLDYGFRGRVVGRGVDLVLEPAQIVCLLGPNGSGKTTLLRTLLGVLPPLAGDVLLDHQSLAEWPARARAGRIGYVPQAVPADFDFTLLEMVEMGRSARRGAFAGPGARDRAASLAALERLGLTPLADRAFDHVSGGERQLALIARAMATEATCLLMDEPTANLDFGNQALILEEVARLRERGASILFTTHHPDQALRVADHVVLLKEGAIMAAGATRDVATSENLSALYGRAIDVVEVETAAGRQGVCVAA